MSAVGGAAGRFRAPTRLRRSLPLAGIARADFSVPAFVLLAGYGMLRWATMLTPSARPRLLGLLLLGTAVLVLLRTMLRIAHSRAATLALSAAAVIAVLAMIPVSGFPLSWTMHLRVAVTVRALNGAVGALPAVTVPYSGGDFAVQAVIALGAGLLLLAGALSLAAVIGPRSIPHRALASLPLLVLAIVPTALERPHLQAVHGAILFLLLVVFLFAGRREGRGLGGMAMLVGIVAMVAIATAVAVPVGGTLSSGPPLLNLTQLVKSIGPAQASTFDWSQTYGPLGANGSGSNATVMTVKAQFPTYWKAENLDVFNGKSWTQLTGGSVNPVADQQLLAFVSVRAARKWIQRLQVTVRAMSTQQVIVAGVAAYPAIQGDRAIVLPGNSPGTWQTTKPLSAGDHYSVEVYTPRPSARQLTAAGSSYPVGNTPGITTTELTVQLPVNPGSAAPPAIQFAPYGHGAPGFADTQGNMVPLEQQLLDNSPYAPVYRLATRLEAGTSTPYGYVRAVLRYLQHGYRYTKNPPKSRYPIPGFLLDTKAGYCQQFAGAMALLLRMGGVPARVAVGFATGTHNSAHRDYVVSGQDAHAWVEVWFPQYGWVPFDPTPAGKQSTANGLPVDSPQRVQPGASTKVKHKAKSVKHQKQPAAPVTVATVRGHTTAVSPSVTVAVLLGLLGLLGTWYTRLRRRLLGPRPPASAQALIRELEKAFARCGSPISAATTLSALERRVGSSDRAAAEYLRRLRLARFGAAAKRPTALQRRALRAWLAAGIGPAGRLRALLALPPRRLN